MDDMAPRKGGAMQEEWYVAIDGSPNGPHARSAVVQMRRSGRIHAHTLVWRDGMPEWARYAGTGLEEPEAPPSPPPMPPTPMVSPSPMRALRNDQADVDSWITERLSRSRTNTPDTAFSHLPPLAVEDDGWQWVEPAPWRRYFARVLDTLMMAVFVWTALAIIIAGLGSDFFQDLFAKRGLFSVPVLGGVIVAASLIPIQALLIGLSGTTIGKCIFGIRITRRDGGAIGIPAALAREAHVFAFGMGCGVPILSLIASFVAFRILNETGSTNWDRGKDWVVTQRRPGVFQVVMFIAGLSVFLLMASYIGHASMARR